MGQLLRKIRKARWLGFESLSWLPMGSLPADPLADLNTQGNKLSVWAVTDDRSNIEAIVTAIASTRDNLAHVDYALFDEALLEGIDISVEAEPGSTPYGRANHWHRDLPKMSGAKLVDLGKAILKHSVRKRVSHIRVRDLLRAAVHSGDLDSQTLHDDLRAEIR